MILAATDTITHLRKLVTKIGERPAGSIAHQKAGDYIRNIFDKTRLAVEEQVIDFPSWSCTDCTLILDDEQLEIDANPFSPACDILASLVAVGTIAELEVATLADKIVLLYGEISSAPLFPIGFTIYNPDRDKTINRLLIEKRPLAILTTNPNSFRHQHIIEDPDMPIPSATISPEAGLQLLQQIEKQVQLRIVSQQMPGTVTTFIARQPRRNRHKLVLCAHYDTKFGTTGAYDNGSGVAALLTLIEWLADSTLAVDLEFIAWADEEYGGNSDQAYAAKTDFDEILAVINLDGIAQYTGTNTITMLAHSDRFQQHVATVTQDYPALAWVDPWFASNHYTFFAHGVPCIAFGCIGTNIIHQANDTIDWIDPSKLAEVVAIVTRIVKLIHDFPVEQARAQTT